MVDSRQKGARAELQARDLLRKHTGLKWERTPSSGALGEQHGLKGDLYVPKEKNCFTVEVKHYKDDQISTKLLTGKTPKLLEWWKQTERQSIQNENLPLLIFKHDRSKWFGATSMHGLKDGYPMWFNYMEFTFSDDAHPVYIFLLEDFIKYEDPIWIL